MFGDMMGKLQEMKQKMDETKNRLKDISVSAEAANGAIKVIASGNKQIKNIEINHSLITEKEELEELLVVAINRALEKAEKVYETEMVGVAGGMIPPGMI
jgi:nucleoid-associated protein EbfC